MSDLPSSSRAVIGAHIGNDLNNYGNLHIRTHLGNPAKKKPPTSLHKFPPCNQFFCGREDVLHQVEEAIVLCEQGQTSLERMLAIIGFGGMGKSEIAKQLAKKLQSKYDFIFWFDAQTKTSLDSDFRNLAALLRIPSKAENSSGLLSSVYISLSQNYRNGIFIFDNAEHLKAEEGHFGIEEYLELDLQCKKPVFLITSRNPWGSARDKIRCVQLDRLSNKDSQKCLLKYMGLENQPLPEGLEETTISLAQSLEGYPLLLSLVGLGFADKAEEISLDTIESRVLSYTKLLQDQSLLKASGESEHEERLQVIFNSTVQKMGETTNGKIAVELLNIIALLSPDSIYVGLVNGIYCSKPFEPHSTLCPRFVWDDLEACVSKGLNILLKNSLIKIESKYKGFDIPDEYDMVKVHRLIQKSTQNWRVSGDESMAPLQKIIRYCEHSDLDLDHIRFLCDVCIQKDLSRLPTCHLLILSALLSFQDTNNFKSFQKLTDLIRVKKLDPDSEKILYVLETINLAMGRYDSWSPLYLLESRGDTWIKVKRCLLGLSPGLANRRWVINLTGLVVVNLNARGPSPQDENTADIRGWLVKCYKECKDGILMGDLIFSILHCIDDNLDWSKDPELIFQLFRCMAEHEMHYFWNHLHSIIMECDTEQLIQFEPLLNRSEADIFSSSLQFSHHSSKIRFLNEDSTWVNFNSCIIKLASILELRNSLLANKGFVDSFWDITSFILKLSTAGLENRINWVQYDRVIQVTGTWCFLFYHDVAVYECFGRNLDSEMNDWLRRSPHSSGYYGVDFDDNRDYTRYVREFAGAKHCSKATRNWILQMLTPENKFRKLMRRILKI